MGYNCHIEKGYLRIDPHLQGAAHRAILDLHNGFSISSSPVGYPDQEWEPMSRRTVVLPQRCLDSEDVFEAIATFNSFYMAEVPDYVPRDLTYKTNAKGEMYDMRDADWHGSGREEELWHAIAPYVRRMTVRYVGEDRARWCYQMEGDGLVWEWAARPWRKVRPLRVEELVRPKPMNLGWTKVTTHNADGTIHQEEVNLATGEKRAWSDPAYIKRPVIKVLGRP